MLSRTADHLFWMARYVERAENTARVLDVTHSTSLLPDDSAGSEAHLWHAPLNISGCAAAYTAKYGIADAAEVTRFIALDPSNPASIHSSLMRARDNARAVRGAITGEMWESINATWLELNRMSLALGGKRLTHFFEWVKERSHLFRVSPSARCSRMTHSPLSAWAHFWSAPTILPGFLTSSIISCSPA